MPLDASIFDGTPSPSMAVPPVAVPAAADPASIFDGTPAAAPAPVSAPVSGVGTWRSVAPRALEPDEPGYKPNSPGGLVNLSREDWSRFSRGEDPRPESVPPPVRKSGYVANVAAGGNAAIASTLGLPVDLATGGINLVTRGVNIALGTNIPPITNPVLGSADIKAGMGAMPLPGGGGANPDDVQADGFGQQLARGIGGGVVSAALPAAAIVPALVRSGAMAAPMAARVLGVTGDMGPQNLLLGGAAGAGAEAAAEQVPDQYKPLAGMVGGIASVGLPLAAVAGGRATARGVQSHYAARSGPVNPILDASGEAITGADGVPLNMLSGEPLAATAGQVQLAGRRFLNTASDPAGVRSTLARQGPPAIPGNPTTAQLTRDPGLLAAEGGAAVMANAQGPFLARIAAENDLRVHNLKAIGDGADVSALPAAVQAHVARENAAGDAGVEAVRMRTAGDVAATDAAGRARVSGVQQAAEQERIRVEAESAARLSDRQTAADQARLAQEAAGQARVGGLEATAATARDAIGGDMPAGSDARVGAAVRAPMVAFDAAARARENAAWRAIDPDGTLSVDMQPIRQGAADILGERSPLAAPLEGKEAAIFQTALDLKDAHSFRDLSAFRARLTNAIRHERISGSDPEAVRRLSMLLDHVHQAMEVSVEKSGDLAAAEQIAGFRDAWQNESENATDTPQSQNGRGSPGQDGSGGSSGVPPLAGAEAGGRSAGRGASGAVASGAADVLAPLKSGLSRRKPPNIIDYIISRGGVREDRGDFRGIGANDIHHRGAGRLINPRGLGSDDMTRDAISEHYLPPNADVDDLKDAIAETIAGNPRYRLHEQAEGEAWDQEKLNASQTGDARYNARDSVATAIDKSGVHLSPAEIEHATDLVMHGVHPETAIQQASDFSANRALEDNAKKNAFGQPGVPLAAQQADNGLHGATRLEPNFDESAAGRYAAARALTVERKGGFDGAPGVKAVLQGGPVAGSFKVADAGVPASIIRVGPSGADHVRVYLAKGGDVEALADAAAFSLRRDATRADGSLDPAKVASWSQKRASFLSALPDAAARFGDSAAAQKALETARAAEAAGLKASDAADARALREAGSAEAQALKAHASEQKRVLKAATAEAEQALKVATATAQKTVNDAVGARAMQVRATQASALGRFLGTADPVSGVAAILNRPTAVSDMQLLVRTIKGNPDAVAGLQRAVGDFIWRSLRSDVVRAGGEEAMLYGAQLQKFIRLKEAALSEIMTPAQMVSLRNIAASLERSNLSGPGSRIGTGSNTMQLAHAGAGSMPSTFFSQFLHKAMSHVGTMAGGGLGWMAGFGPTGAVLGGALGHLGDWAVQSLEAGRAAGFQTVDDLFANMMLNPQLAAVLVARHTPENREALGRALLSQLRRISLVSGAVGQQDRQVPQNGLLP